MKRESLTWNLVTRLCDYLSRVVELWGHKVYVLQVMQAQSKKETVLILLVSGWEFGSLEMSFPFSCTRLDPQVIGLSDFELISAHKFLMHFTIYTIWPVNSAYFFSPQIASYIKELLKTIENSYLLTDDSHCTCIIYHILGSPTPITGMYFNINCVYNMYFINLNYLIHYKYRKTWTNLYLNRNWKTRPVKQSSNFIWCYCKIHNK